MSMVKRAFDLANKPLSDKTLQGLGTAVKITGAAGAFAGWFISGEHYPVTGGLLTGSSAAIGAIVGAGLSSYPGRTVVERISISAKKEGKLALAAAAAFGLFVSGIEVLAEHESAKLAALAAIPILPANAGLPQQEICKMLKTGPQVIDTPNGKFRICVEPQ